MSEWRYCYNSEYKKYGGNMATHSKFLQVLSYTRCQLIILSAFIIFIISCDDNTINSNPSNSPDLCYQKMDDNSHWQIFTNNISGTNPENISNNPNNDCYDPAWSPDGQYIAFRWDKSVGGCDIYLYDIFSDSLINLTTDLSATESASLPEWTPDGEKIVYTQRNNGINYQYIMNKDGSDKRKLNDWINFFYNDSYHIICQRDNSIFKSNIINSVNEFIIDIKAIGEEYTKLYDFNPITEDLLFLIADTPRKTNIIAEYNVQTQKLDTLSVADSGWVYLLPQYSNDYAKIAFIERNYDKDISNMVIIENGVKKDLVTLTDEDEWIYNSPIVFSPYDNYLAYSKNINQEGYLVWWKSYLYIVNIETKKIKFIDGESAVDPVWNPLLTY